MAALPPPADEGSDVEVSSVLRELQRVAAFAQHLRSANDELKHELGLRAEAAKTSDEERARLAQENAMLRAELATVAEEHRRVRQGEVLQVKARAESAEMRIELQEARSLATSTTLELNAARETMGELRAALASAQAAEAEQKAARQNAQAELHRLRAVMQRSAVAANGGARPSLSLKGGR